MTDPSPTPAVAAPERVWLTVVLPAYREQDLIAATLGALRAGLAEVAPGGALELIVVDDGSDDETVARARAAGADWVIPLGRNRGKGAAVRAGMLAAAGDIVAFTDADLQYPPDRLAALLQQMADDVGAVIGARRVAHGTGLRRLGAVLVTRLAHRIVLGGAGAPAAHDKELDKELDTQCGLKVFRRDVARQVFGQCRIDRFGFDVEVVLLLSLLDVRWLAEEVVPEPSPRGSTVRILRDGLGLLADLLRIRIRHHRGGYTIHPTRSANPTSSADLTHSGG